MPNLYLTHLFNEYLYLIICHFTLVVLWRKWINLAQIFLFYILKYLIRVLYFF